MTIIITEGDNYELAKLLCLFAFGTVIWWNW